MQNDEWSVKVSIDKIDSETKQRIKGDAEFKIFAWDTVRQCYIPNGGYNQYKVERQSGGTYKVINHSDYAGGSDDLFYTQRNEGKFVIVESRAPSGYYGDWTDVTKPGTAGSVLGKRAYAFEITKAQDGQTIWLGNADYNADISTTNSGGTLIDTGEGIVTITFGDRAGNKTYSTDLTGIANNEDVYTMYANANKMQNDRVLGNILLTKVDLDAARYLAAGSNGDTTLEGAVYDLYAADTIEHPDGVSGVVDYSKITDANGTPIWHTTALTNGGWDTDYLPILQKDRLVASAKITDGKLAFANLYMGRYYLVERATGLVLPIDGNGKLYVTGKYPQLNKKLERTGKYSSLATKGGEYTDYIYKNQYSAVAESRKLNGSKAWDGYYLSYAKGYLCDEVNHYETLTYADESAYHIHAEQESQDEVLKSGFSLQKLVSTTGQPSPALKLEGAGFTVYRISKLSKAAQFKKNPDGSYDAQSILDAYLLNRLGEAESLLRLFLLEVPTRILYIDYDADGQPTFCAASSRVPQLLRSALWNTREPAILTSGTLAAAGDFSHTEQLLGLTTYRPLRHFRADSPFNYKKKCLLYFPPRVKTRMDNGRMAEEIVRLVDACHGHALVLFTAYRQMAEVRALTDGQWTYPTYQAWRNGGKIIQQFKQSGNGVLFAAGSCWEGIDFPGDMVSLLIIAKLPFPIPDPVSNYERQQYPNLHDYITAEIIPEMQKKLRQGFGRAIRTEQDSCVVAILDERAGIGGKYHDAALAALPTCPTTEKIEDVQQFIREQKRPDYFL